MVSPASKSAKRLQATNMLFNHQLQGLGISISNLGHQRCKSLIFISQMITEIVILYGFEGSCAAHTPYVYITTPLYQQLEKSIIQNIRCINDI